MAATIERLETTDVSLPPSFALMTGDGERADMGGAVAGATKGHDPGEDAHNGGEQVRKGKLQGLQLSTAKVVQQIGGNVRSFADFAQAIRSAGDLVEFAVVERPEVRLLLLEVCA